MSGTVFENIPKEELMTLAKASEFSMWPKKYRGTSMLKFFAEVRDWDYAKWLLEENVFKGADGDLFRSVGRIFKSRQELFSDPEKLYEAVGGAVVVKEPEIVVSEDSGLLAIEVPYEPKLTDWVKAVPASFDKASKRWYAAKSSSVKSYLKSASSFPKGYAPKIKWETDVDLSTKKPSFSGLKMKPYPYQEDGIRFLMSGNVVLADDMGMGKTLQTIGAVVASGAKTVMVACPSVVARNWKAEFMKATGKFHDDEIVVMDDGAEGREIVLSGLPRRKKIVLIYSYDALRRDIGHESFKDCVFDLVVADEAHMVGSESNQRRKALVKVRGDWRIALSGTPFS